jgi:hypothetical protein
LKEGIKGDLSLHLQPDLSIKGEENLFEEVIYGPLE